MVIAELLYTNGAGEVFVLVGDGAPRYRYQEEIRSWVLYTRNGMVIVPRDHVVRMSIKEDGVGSWASEPKQKGGDK